MLNGNIEAKLEADDVVCNVGHHPPNDLSHPLRALGADCYSDHRAPINTLRRLVQMHLRGRHALEESIRFIRRIEVIET